MNNCIASRRGISISCVGFGVMHLERLLALMEARRPSRTAQGNRQNTYISNWWVQVRDLLIDKDKVNGVQTLLTL